MPHVQQRFLVHRLVLEDGEHRLGAIEHRMSRLLDVGVEERVDHLPVGLACELVNGVARWPLSRPTRPTRPTCPTLVRIDSSGEQRFEVRVDARTAKPLLHERIETEAGEMSFVEDDRMTERDRLAIVRLFGEQIEERARSRAVLPVPGDERRTVDSHPCIFIRNWLEWALELRITLNGDAHELAGPLTVTELLAHLDIDARRVAVEHNLVVLKRDAFAATVVREGDEIEIVNFVGGGGGGLPENCGRRPADCGLIEDFGFRIIGPRTKD
jgi:sulfur carrier protein